MNDSKPWYKSKMIWFAVLQAIAGITAAMVTQNPTLGWATTLNSVVQVILRFTTSSPIL